MSKRPRFSLNLGLAALLSLACQMAACFAPPWANTAALWGRSCLRLEKTAGLGIASGGGDRIWLSQTVHTATINVSHKTGIGAVKLTLQKGKWPEKIKLVLHRFSSLENVTVCGGTESLQISKNHGEKLPDAITILVPIRVVSGASTLPGNHIAFSWVDAYR